MDVVIENYLKDIAIDKLMNSPIGVRLQKAMGIMDDVCHNMHALAEKQGEQGVTGMKAVTVLTFSLLKKVAEGKRVSELSKEDWIEIAKTVSEYAVILDDQMYSVFVFEMYERYIRSSLAQIKEVISPEVYAAIVGLADELHMKEEMLFTGGLSEMNYIDDCLWISLEVMVKLLASTAFLTGSSEIADISQAFATYAFEYGRMMLYKKEQNIINKYIEAQYQLDLELEAEYNAYLKELKVQAEQFVTLIDNAFAADFREAFLGSIAFAQRIGVPQGEVLTSIADIDDFFLE